MNHKVGDTGNQVAAMSSDIGKLMTYPVNRKQAFKMHVSISALGRERPLRRAMTMSDKIAPREAGIGQYSSFAVRDTLTYERPDSS